MATVTFLGTGGARVLVFKQLLASGGLWVDWDGTRLSLDPGPGALVQAVKRKLAPTRLEGIILSHRADHLTVAQAQRPIEQVRPKKAVLTHFGMTIWRARPWEIARRMSEETGVEVTAARDGMRLELE